MKLDNQEELGTHCGLIETLLFHLTGKIFYYIRIDKNKDGFFKLLATSIHEFIPPLGELVISTHGQNV